MTKWENTPLLPYLNNEEYLKTLQIFTDTKPVRKCLLVWGAKSVTKSEGLQIKKQEWEKNGHPVIDIDLKGFNRTWSSFVYTFYQETEKALKNAGIPITYELRVAVRERSLSRTSNELVLVTQQRVRDFWSWFPDFISRTGEKLKRLTRGELSEQDARSLETAADTTGRLSQLSYAYLRQLFSRPRPDTLETVFDMLELIALQVEKPPIVIVREIQALDVLRDHPEYGKECFKRLFEFFEPRKQGTSKVPVIIETSDFLWARTREISDSRESFRPYQVQLWNKQALYKLLVQKTLSGFSAPIFTDEEFEKVWDHAGGHPGALYTLHDRLREGEQLESAIEAEKDYYFGIVRSNVVITEEKDPEKHKALVADRKAALLKLRENNYRLAVDDPHTDKAIHYLLVNNVLFWAKGFVTPQNPPMQTAIATYLSMFCAQQQ